MLTSLAWYQLDEVAGTVATDTSGNGHHGAVTGGAWSDGQAGGAIEFNADGNISVPATTFATVDQQVTFAFWAYGGDTQPASDSILYGVNGAGDRVFNVHLPFSNGIIYWDAGQDGGYDRINKTGDPLVHKDSWHHWAFTKNATTGNMNIYLDGEVWHSGTGKTKSMTGVTAFTLGANTNGSSGYDGLLDDVRIYDVELTAAEVMNLFTSTTSPNTEEVFATNDALAVNESDTATISTTILESTDAEQSAAELTYTVTGVPGNGTLHRSGSALGLYDTFTQEDVDNNLVTYDHSGGRFASDSFTFVVNDGFGSATSGTLNITVNHVSDTDLVALLSLDGNADDTSPHGANNNGAVQGGASYVVEEHRGQVLSLDGVDDVMTIANSGDINTSTVTQRTISLAFNADDVNARQVLLEEGGSTRALVIYIDGGKLYVGGLNSPSGESGWGGTWLSVDIVAGQWNHVALTLSGGPTIQPGAVSGFLNGQLFAAGDGSQVWPHSDGIGVGGNNGSTSYHDGSSSASNLFAGSLDDIRIYNRTLSAEEIGILAGRYTVNSLAELRALGISVDNSMVVLGTTGGDPHPVTGVVTPGEYWINGDHYTDPTNSMPIFMELSGNDNTYDLTGTTIRLDTRKLDGFGRNLGHDSGVDVIRVSGANNIVRGINLIGEDIALDTDPNAQRYADWATQYVELSGNNNTIDGVNVVTRGSRTDAYGLGDAFGKGSSGGIQPFLSHRKASAFRVGEATNAVINDMHLQVNTFGHGFFVQASTDTTLTNSTITGELFSSQGVIDHPLYQQYGHTYWGNPIPDDILISGAEGGVRMYTGASGLTVDGVVVTNMRTGFAVTLGSGTITLNNVEAYGTEGAFNFKSNTTITNAKADAINGPLIVIDKHNSANSSIDVELVGATPINHDYAIAYVSGNNVDINITSNLPAEYFGDPNILRVSQFYWDNWRESQPLSGPEVAGYDHINSTIVNNTNMTMLLGEEAIGNSGSSLGPVITNGKENHYDGISLVPTGTHTVVQHTAGLGNNGMAADGTLETNASIVDNGGTLELLPDIRITDEKLKITGNGVSGQGALYSDGSVGSGTRFGSSNNGDESTIFLDGNASIGVGVAGNQLLVGRIQGTGDLTKLGAGKLSVEKSTNLVGDLIVAEGHITGRSNVVRADLTVAAGASVSAIGENAFNTNGDVIVDGQMDLNSRTDNNTIGGKVGRLLGSGQVISSNPFAGSGGNLEIEFSSGSATFTGQISTAVSLVKSDTGTQILSGINTYTGTTTVSGGFLQVDGTHTSGDGYTVNASGTLGGNGSIGSAVAVNANGRLSPGTSAGSLSVGGVTLSSGAFFDVEIGGTVAGSEYDQLTTDSADLGGLLTVSLLQPGGTTFLPALTDSFTVLVSSTSLSGVFENVASGQRLETIGGEGSFLVTYGPGNTVLLSDFVPVADYGDAPSSYGILATDDGARHLDQGPRLGATRDVESDGQPSASADADGADDDGVMFGVIGIGSSLAGVNIDLQNGTQARVDAWLDFDGDGVWQTDEKILDNVLASDVPGFQTFNFNVNADAVAGDTFARVRVSSAGGLDATGLADDGEVEDYQVTLHSSAAPTVDDVTINEGNQQRSILYQVDVTFDSEVSAPAAAFQIVHRDSGQVLDALNVDSTVTGGKTASALTFGDNGNLVENRLMGPNSLIDGNYELRIDRILIEKVGGGPNMIADYRLGDQEADEFFRYFSDSDGDRDTDADDLTLFADTFRADSNNVNFDATFDADGDNDVDADDLIDFASRFRLSMPFA